MHNDINQPITTMSKARKIKAYAKESTVPNIGTGLFANINITKGSIITESAKKLELSKR